MNAHTLASVLLIVTTSGGAVWFLCAGLVACAKPVTFEGDTSISVIGERPTAPRIGLEDDAIVVEGAGAAWLHVLNEVAAMSKQNPGVKMIIFKSASPDAHARAVRDYLVAHGVAEDVAVSGVFEADEAPEHPN